MHVAGSFELDYTSVLPNLYQNLTPDLSCDPVAHLDIIDVLFVCFFCHLHVQLASDATVRHSCVEVGGGYKRYTHQDEHS